MSRILKNLALALALGLGVFGIQTYQRHNKERAIDYAVPSALLQEAKKAHPSLTENEQYHLAVDEAYNGLHWLKKKCGVVGYPLSWDTYEEAFRRFLTLYNEWYEKNKEDALEWLRHNPLYIDFMVHHLHKRYKIGDAVITCMHYDDGEATFVVEKGGNDRLEIIIYILNTNGRDFGYNGEEIREM